MSHRAAILLAGALAAGPAIGVASAQITKPTISTSTEEPPPTERLPAPAHITAVQEPTGRIRVVWSAVDGAVKYGLVRSVPPAPVAPVSLPTPSDTVYVDPDVTPGKTYYYQVYAINSANLVGLKISAPPVLAVDMAPAVAPSPPTGVKAAVYGTTLSVTWTPVQGMRYLLDRANATNTSIAAWLRVWEGTAGGFAYGAGADGSAPGTRLIYRVTAQDSKGMQSQPALSNEITVPPTGTTDTTKADTATTTPVAGATTTVRPAVVPPPATVKVGSSLKLGTSSTFTGLQLTKARWLSLDESKATVDSQGKVLGRAAGSAHIIAIGTTADGAVASLVQRVDVTGR